METHDPNVYPTILGGVSRGFWTPFLDRGAQSAIFWHVKMPEVPTCGRRLDLEHSVLVEMHCRVQVTPIKRE